MKYPLWFSICFLMVGWVWGQNIQTVFESPYTTWKDADVLLWPSDGAPSFPPAEFCLALRRANGGIGNPSCRIAGDWQRDSAANLYAQWLANNMQRGLQPIDLRARSPLTIQRLRNLVDQMLVLTSVRNDTLWAALFEGSVIEPKSVGFLVLPQDPITIANAIAQAWFTSPTQRRLTDAERAQASQAPDPYYAEKPLYDAWVGVALGYTQAQIPLTPDSWYRSKLQSRIKNYRNVQDSLTAWSFVEDQSVLQSVYGGASFFGFLGLELGLRHSHHKAKFDRSDTLYHELDHWNFDRYEFSIGCLLTRTYALPYRLETRPHFFLSFIYSFMSEDIGLRSGQGSGSASYRSRFQFEDFYRGGIVGLGNRLVFDQKVALDFRAGFASRGRSLDKEPSPDAVAEPTIIGGATFDGFIQIGLEYHWQWK